VRIAYVADLPTPDEAIRMIDGNGGASATATASASSRGMSAPTASAISSATARAAAVPRGAPEASARPQMAAPAPEVQAAPALRLSSFPELIALAGERRDLMTKSALEADVRLVRFDDGRLEIALERHAQRGLVNDLSRKLEQWTNRRWTVVVSNEPGQATIREQNLVAKGERERAAESDPRVREVLARFPGAKLVEVRRLAAEPPESDVSPPGLEDGFAGDEAPDDPDNDF
jgi:DNA polymerase-3 subunit gamma/tau